MLGNFKCDGKADEGGGAALRVKASLSFASSEAIRYIFILKSFVSLFKVSNSGL